jgi:hypothetical protein
VRSAKRDILTFADEPKVLIPTIPKRTILLSRFIDSIIPSILPEKCREQTLDVIISDCGADVLF